MLARSLFNFSHAAFALSATVKAAFSSEVRNERQSHLGFRFSYICSTLSDSRPVRALAAALAQFLINYHPDLDAIGRIVVRV